MVAKLGDPVVPIRIPEVNTEPIAYVYHDQVIICFGTYTPDQWRFINVEVYKALEKLGAKNNVGSYSSGPAKRPG